MIYLDNKKFDKVHKHYDSFMKRFNLYKTEEVIQMLDLTGEEVILDIGGGTGHLARSLEPHCKRIYVIDESKKMLSKIKPFNSIIPILGDVFDLSVIDEALDVVIMTDVFHHIEGQEKLLEIISNKLKKGGKFIMMDFDKNHLKVKLLMLFERILFGKLYFKTVDELKDMVSHNFKLIDCMDNKYYIIILGVKYD